MFHMSFTAHDLKQNSTACHTFICLHVIRMCVGQNKAVPALTRVGLSLFDTPTATFQLFCRICDTFHKFSTCRIITVNIQEMEPQCRKHIVDEQQWFTKTGRRLEHGGLGPGPPTSELGDDRRQRSCTEA